MNIIEVHVTGADKQWPRVEEKDEPGRWYDMVRKTFDTIDAAIAFAADDDRVKTLNGDVFDRVTEAHDDVREERRRIVDDRAFGERTINGRGTVMLEVQWSARIVKAKAVA